MKDLLELYPITGRIAFLEVELDILLKEFLNWQNALISKHNNLLHAQTISGNLFSVFSSLCPLTTVEARRYLIIPTKSNWVAFLDNGHTGTDRTCPSVMAEKLNVKYVYTANNPNTMECLIDYYEKVNNKTQLVRSIAVIKENGWKFHQYGRPLSFEKTDQYDNKQIKSRFNYELLKDYLTNLGINAFDEDYYDVKNGAILINKTGPKFSATRELTLKEANSFFRG